VQFVAKSLTSGYFLVRGAHFIVGKSMVNKSKDLFWWLIPKRWRDYPLIENNELRDELLRREKQVLTEYGEVINEEADNE
jgi:hypothetical protein